MWNQQSLFLYCWVSSIIYRPVREVGALSTQWYGRTMAVSELESTYSFSHLLK